MRVLPTKYIWAKNQDIFNVHLMLFLWILYCRYFVYVVFFPLSIFHYFRILLRLVDPICWTMYVVNIVGFFYFLSIFFFNKTKTPHRISLKSFFSSFRKKFHFISFKIHNSDLYRIDIEYTSKCVRINCDTFGRGIDQLVCQQFQQQNNRRKKFLRRSWRPPYRQCNWCCHHFQFHCTANDLEYSRACLLNFPHACC